LKQLGEWPDAATALRQAIRLQPDLAGAHSTLASVLRQLGDTAGAAEERRIAEELSKAATNRQAATFATSAGKRLFEEGEIEGALAQFRAAIKLAPAFAPAHYHLALALEKKGQHAEAEREFQKAEELDPRFKRPEH
jgi:tetratricopeptide (TPR) repeat protein